MAILVLHQITWLMNGSGFIKNALGVNRNYQVLLNNKGSNKFNHFDVAQYTVRLSAKPEPLIFKNAPLHFVEELRNRLHRDNRRKLIINTSILVLIATIAYTTLPFLFF